ncbi:MAG: NAD(P)H-dependent oxidoreductase [Hyphomonadaceae bacterium]
MAQKILIIDGHPDPARARLCHALADAYVDGALASGKETRLISLAEAPVEILRSAAEFATPPVSEHILRAQADIAWADHLVLVFPLWLGGAPALLRAFLEQTARGNFFAATEGAGIRQKFKGKSARVIVTMGMPALIYRLMFHAHGVKNITEGVLGFAGFAPVRMTLFGAVENTRTEKQRANIETVRMQGREGK